MNPKIFHACLAAVVVAGFARADPIVPGRYRQVFREELEALAPMKPLLPPGVDGLENKEKQAELDRQWRENHEKNIRVGLERVEKSLNKRRWILEVTGTHVVMRYPNFPMLDAFTAKKPLAYEKRGDDLLVFFSEPGAAGIPEVHVLYWPENSRYLFYDGTVFEKID